MKYFALLLSAALLFSCGKSVDKDSLEGRVASFVSLQKGVYMAVSIDLKNIIEKSGIKEGAIPEQYLNTISPYLDALNKSINLEKQIYLMPNINTSNMDKSDFVLMFEVGDLNALKKEIKEFGINLKKKSDLEYGIKSEMAFGIYKGETAFFVIKENGRIDEKTLMNYSKNLSKGETIDGVVDFVTTKSDIAAFYSGDKMMNTEIEGLTPEFKELTKKMIKLYEGTYWIAKVDFNNQDAVMEVEMNLGKNLEKYAPFMRSELSDGAKSILVVDNPVAAYAVNMDMENILTMVIDQLDQKTQDEMNKQLAMLGGIEKLKQLLTGEFAFAMALGDEPIVTSFIGVGDQKQVRSMIDGFGFFLGLKKKGDVYDFNGAQLMFNENGLFYAPNSNLMSKMKSNKTSKLRNMNGFNFGDSPMSMFVDFKALVKLKEIEDYKEVIKAFDFMTFEMNDKGGNGLIRSTKKGQNILRTLVEAFIEMQRIDEERQAEIAADFEQEMTDAEWEEFYGSENWDETW